MSESAIALENNRNIVFEYLDKSDAAFESIIPVVQSDVEFAPYIRLLSNNQARIRILKEERDFDTAIERLEENIEYVEKLKQANYNGIEVGLPNAWFEMGELYVLKKDYVLAKTTLERAEVEYQSLLDGNPNNTGAYDGVKKTREKLTEIQNISP